MNEQYQEQQYERFSPEAERYLGLAQGTQDMWSEGEKIRPEESLHQKEKGKVSLLVISVLAIVLLFVVLFLVGILVFLVTAHGASHAVPMPMPKP